ncbi:hypothetical protein ALUC_80969S [Aspergillus luchuensis]|nr:hypothetical protein ALUC_80969S [Aspergillus luchuensis]
MNRSITEYIVKGRGDSAVSDTLYTPPDRVDHSARVDASESKGSKRLRVNYIFSFFFSFHLSLIVIKYTAASPSPPTAFRAR